VETLLVWGIRQILFIGWCGAVAKHVEAGDIIVPDSAMVDEGTSGHYLDPACRVALPSRHLAGQIHQTLERQGLDYHSGAIWTTDAIFRETVAKVKHYQRRGALAVEMELSAVFTVAAFRNAAAAGILVVSDTLSTYQWQPGFRTPAFKTARMAVCRAALSAVGYPEIRQKNI
jgi:purine-nucleoside phosphorylase